MTLFVSDLDGTLLDGNAKLKKRALDMLNRLGENGVAFTIATARGWRGVTQKIIKGLKLDYPVITHNGAVIVDPKTGKRLVANTLTDEQKKHIKNVITEKNICAIIHSIVNDEDRISWHIGGENKALKNFLRLKKGDERLRPCESFDDVFDGEIYYVSMLAPTVEKAELDEAFPPERGFQSLYIADTYNTDEFWYEIFSPNANKGNGIDHLRRLTGAEKVVCFGDNLNDIPMFKHSDESYAVANAHDELKRLATGVIGANYEDSVPIFIESYVTKTWHYEPKAQGVDSERFKLAVEKALERERAGIGTLNEKLIHATLKNYYSASSDEQEIKIGGYYTDAMGENGIFEIQTASFNKLRPKLAAFLQCSHVTVVYPMTESLRLIYIDSETGEILKKSPVRRNKSFVKFFLELYRIKEFLHNPNLSICVAMLEIEEKRVVDGVPKRGRKQALQRIKTPLSLRDELYFHKPEDFARFMPEGLADEFTKKEYLKASKQPNASLELEIMRLLGLVDIVGKRGNGFVYRKR